LALIDSAVQQFGEFTPAADNPSGIDSDGYDLNNLNAMLADGNQIEITTVPGEFTTFLEVTADWIENAGSTTRSLVCESVANPQFPLSFSTLPLFAA
jgi:hypothetical protein